MKKKILCIFVCMLLIATVLPTTGTLIEKTNPSSGGIELVPILDFINIKGGLLGISVVLMNSGHGTAYDIEWSMNITEGSLWSMNITLFYPRKANGGIDLLEPGDEYEISITPMIGLGQATVTFYYSYTIILDTLRNEVDVEGKQEWRDQGMVIVHSFEGEQPTKEWMKIADYLYIEGNKVLLYYVQGIRNMHNVRCLNSLSSNIEFQSACCFQNGEGLLNEGWFTKSHIESQAWEWEVELVNEN